LTVGSCHNRDRWAECVGGRPVFCERRLDSSRQC